MEGVLPASGPTHSSRGHASHIPPPAWAIKRGSHGLCPDGGGCILAQLHDSPAPASFTALSLLHFPIPATSPLVLCELLQQLLGAAVFWAGRVEGSGQRGLQLVDLSRSGGRASIRSTRSDDSGSVCPPPPPMCLPLPFLVGTATYLGTGWPWYPGHSHTRWGQLLVTSQPEGRLLQPVHRCTT